LSCILALDFPYPVTLLEKIESLKHRLTTLEEVLNNKFPGNTHGLPSPEQINIQKLGHGGVTTTNTCNQAQKIRCMICDQVVGAFDYDCLNPLQNTWFGAIEKNSTKELYIHLCTSLDEIDPKLRVTTSMSAIICAVDKEFSLLANYPKGHCKLFLEWIKEYYPGVLLLHVEHAAGSRQDICMEGSMAVYELPILCGVLGHDAAQASSQK
jgi:hypothetical protein